MTRPKSYMLAKSRMEVRLGERPCLRPPRGCWEAELGKKVEDGTQRIRLFL